MGSKAPEKTVNYDWVKVEALQRLKPVMHINLLLVIYYRQT